MNAVQEPMEGVQGVQDLNRCDLAAPVSPQHCKFPRRFSDADCQAQPWTGRWACHQF